VCPAEGGRRMDAGASVERSAQRRLAPGLAQCRTEPDRVDRAVLCS
jgi:hypothetical protein